MFHVSAVGGGLLQGIQIDKLLYMKWYNVFILVAWIHCFAYISNGIVTRGYIPFVFIIFFLVSMLLQVGQVVLLLVVLFTGGFGEAVMYDGALIRVQM